MARGKARKKEDLLEETDEEKQKIQWFINYINDLMNKEGVTLINRIKVISNLLGNYLAYADDDSANTCFDYLRGTIEEATEMIEKGMKKNEHP